MTVAGRTEKESLLEMCYTDTGMFAKAFIPEGFSAPYSVLNRQMIAAIDSPHQKIVIAAPRGIGKTTTVLAYMMKGILYRDFQFGLYISKSEKSAVLQTENMKRELKSNPDIRRIFGDIALATDDPDADPDFAKLGWTAFGNTYILPRGSGQQVRGLRYKYSRPDLIVVDDLEDREEMMNPETRLKIKEWFHADLEKCIDRYNNKYKVIYIDTLKHSDSLLQELLDSPDWVSLRLDLCDDEYNSMAPELFSTAELKREAEAHRNRGQLHIFFMEYRNLPTSPEISSFKQAYFKYYEEAALDKTGLENMVLVDLAKTIEIQNAETALVGIGFDAKSGAIYIRDVVHGHLLPDQIYDEMFAMRRRLNARVVGIEITGLNEFIKQPILNEIRRRGPAEMFEPVWLAARGGDKEQSGKLKRIGSLLPYYRQGFIYHNKTACMALEAQLLAFPRGKLVDVADATAYLVEMLYSGNRYFHGPTADPELPADLYADIDYEPALTAEYLRC